MKLSENDMACIDLEHPASYVSIEREEMFLPPHSFVLATRSNFGPAEEYANSSSRKWIRRHPFRTAANIRGKEMRREAACTSTRKMSAGGNRREGIQTTNHNDIYSHQAETYESMIGKQPDLSAIVHEIRPFQQLDVLDLGAGTGRLSAFLAREAKSLICTDLSPAMLDALHAKLQKQGLSQNWTTLVADHRQLPVADRSVDLVVAGWSMCYLAHEGNEAWRVNLESMMREVGRVLRSGGTIIIMETMGTGTETPAPPNFLTPYYAALVNDYGFHFRWTRTDYTFDSVEEAVRHIAFFFGQELADDIERNQWAIVPECAGIWWKHC